MISTLDFICLRLNGNTPEILLKRRDNENEPAFGEFTLIGGMIWESPREGSEIYDIDMESASKRILKNKFKGDFLASYKEQLNDVGSIDRDKRGWSKTTPYLCFFKYSDTLYLENDSDYKWVSLYDVINDKIKLPFDHNYLVNYAYMFLVTKARYSSNLFYFLEDEFVVSDILNCFSAFGLSLTKQTVTKRWVNKELIIPTGEKRKNKDGGKPATIYKLANNELVYFEFSLSPSK